MKQKTYPNDSAFTKTATYNPNTLNHNGDDAYGLTKREYFAAMAMQGFVSKYGTDYLEECAKDSVKQADALIKALNE